MNAPLALGPAESCADSRFTVPGVRCAGCIAKIERGLGALPGVVAARVNFSAKRVAVQHLPEVTDETLLAALEELGFEAQRAAENPLARDDAETRRLLRALAVAGFGMMNIMLLSVSIWSGADGATRELFHWLSGAIALPVVAYSGRPFFASAWMALSHKRTNMDVPISIGVVLATLLSVYETVTGGAHAYFDGAVMLLFFLLAGRALDAVMRDRARSGIGALLGRMGRGATVIEADGASRWVAADRLEPGMTMLVAAGEALAADGTIIDGKTMFDLSMLTGESAPQHASEGDMVHAGTLNLGSPVRVRITAASGHTTLDEIARLMDEAGQSRSRYVRIADRASRLYAPAVHTLAALSYAGWMSAGAGLHQSLLIGIAVLIVTCPCAIGLAVPAAQVVASGALMKRGVLVKDGSALERLAEADHALFDKTGTLTRGEPRPVSLDGLDAGDLGAALALAQASRHPLSRGLAAALRDRGVVAAPVTEIHEKSGEGVTGQLGSEQVGLLRSQTASEGLALDFVRGSRRVHLAFSDPLRNDVEATLAALATMGIPSAIASGDSNAAVTAVAHKLGLFAAGNLRPADKLALLQRRAAAGERVLMVGDGLNDGPALAAAHVSLAPATASDASQQAADVVFLGDGLMPVAIAVRAARRTMRVVRQNFAFAILYNFCAVPLAIAGQVTPLIAALAMSGSSLVVVANSLRLARAAR